MELSEYRKRRRERATRIYGGAAFCVAGADVTSHLNVLDHVQGALLDLPWHGGVTGLVVAGGAVGATFWARQRRGSLEYQRRQVLHAREWAGRRDRRKYIGLASARSLAKKTRPGMTRVERLRAHPAEVGIPVGKTVSGPSGDRGRHVVVSWEEGGALVLGEPGARKSTFLAGVVVGAPGAQVVVSTKDEFLTRTWEGRAGRGPVFAFCPLSPDSIPDKVMPFRWSLVAGCRDPHTAQRRANALMSATASAGLANAGFWEGKGRAVLSALLCAADLQGAGLRKLARWLQEERYNEAAETLERWPDVVEASMVGTLRQMASSDRTASSVSHTASAVLEFLQDGRIAAALDADRDNALDLVDFVRNNGTLYMVTDNSPALGPVVTAIWDSIVDAAKEVAQEQRGGGDGEARLRNPLLLTADEVDKTMPSVPLDNYAAELRGWGIFTLAATQNHARLVKAWGRDGADALRHSLQVHIILSINSGDDRQYYEKRLGTRKVEFVRTSESQPTSVKHRMFGNPSKSGHSQSNSIDQQHPPLWESSMWSFLDRGRAVVVPTKGAPAVVDIGNGWEKAKAATQAARAGAAQRAWREEAEAAAAAARRAAEAEAEARRATRQEGAL